MHEITLSQGTIRYRDEGRGPTLVFVHGLLVDGQLWRNVAAPLSRTHRCIVPDWPLGSHRVPMNRDADLSPAGVAEIVGEFLDALELENVTLVGNDSGGAISQLVAARHGQRISRLVLTTCDAFEIFPPKQFEYLRTVVKVPGLMWAMGRALLHIPPIRKLGMAYGAVAKSGVPKEVLRSWVEPAATSRAIRYDLAKFCRTVSSKYTMEAAAELHNFKGSALLLWTPEDKFFPLSLAERLADVLGDARIETIDDAWVFVPEDQPEAVAASIERFTSAKPALAKVASI